MLKNYLLIAFRNLIRHKVFSGINILGLSIGICACLSIYLIVSFELSFDSFHQDRERIYRVYSQFTGTFEATNRGVPGPVAESMRNSFTGLQSVAGFHTFGGVVSIEDENNIAKKKGAHRDIIFADPHYFEVLSSYEWLAGSPKNSLSEPYQVVLTQKKARNYFGPIPFNKILGRKIHYNDSLVVTVSGIVKDFEKNSDLIFNDFISLATAKNSWLKNTLFIYEWGNTSSSSQLFIKFSPGTTPQKIEAQLPALSKKYALENPDADWTLHFRLQPLGDLHFNNKLGIFDDSRAVADLPTLRILTLIALLLLLIASINFINLETAQATRRAKEIGIRKTLGSTRNDLILQFLGETFLLTCFATALSIVFTEFILHFFKEFIPEGVHLDLSEPSVFLFLIGITLVISILSGIYPGMVISSFNPVKALKNQVYSSTSASSNILLRRALIVFQFAFAQVLIVGTFIITKQIDFMLSKDMGFAKDAIVYFYVPGNEEENKKFVLQQELLKVPEVSHLSLHNSPPAMDGYSSGIFYYNNGKEILKHNVYHKFGDTAFLDLYEMTLIAGRNLLPSDTVKEYIINQTYARQLGFEKPEQALNQLLQSVEKQSFPIVGVVKDFHIQSLHKPIEPVIIANATKDFGCFSVRLQTNGKSFHDFQQTLHKIEQQWKSVYPSHKFDYRFLEDTVAKFYETEQRSIKLMRTATGVAILISCLGLYGLSAFVARQRIKEMAVRKVLGASISQIVQLLSKDFIKLIIAACVLAWPLAWWAGQYWLQDFAYQTQVGWLVFASAGFLALLIALITISYQALKTALINPVKSLRNE